MSSSSFRPVNIEESLIEPDGFYSKINEGSKKKLVLIQIPKNFDLESLNNCKIEQNQIVNSEKVIHSFVEVEGVPASLAMPANVGFTMNTEILGTSFFSIKDPLPATSSSITSSTKKRLPEEKVIDSAVRGRSQPKTLTRPALNSLDFRTFISHNNYNNNNNK